eukprot:c7087_g1_i1 orf=106-468(-)
MGTRSEAREQQLLQAIHEVSSDSRNPDNPTGSLEQKGIQDIEGNEGEEGGNRAVLQLIGELVSHSAQSVKETAQSVKETVLSKEVDQSKQELNTTPPNEIADSQDESVQVSLLVHTIVHD